MRPLPLIFCCFLTLASALPTLAADGDAVVGGQNTTVNPGKPVNGWVRLDRPGENGSTVAAAPTAAQQLPMVPLAGEAAADQKAKCRVRKTVEAGVAMGGVSGKYVGAELAYGKDDRAMAGGYMPNPCPDTNFSMSVAVSQSDMELKRRHLDRYDGAYDPYRLEQDRYNGIPGPLDR